MLKAGFKVLTDVNKIMKAEAAKTQKWRIGPSIMKHFA